MTPKHFRVNIQLIVHGQNEDDAQAFAMYLLDSVLLAAYDENDGLVTASVEDTVLASDVTCALCEVEK